MAKDTLDDVLLDVLREFLEANVAGVVAVVNERDTVTAARLGLVLGAQFALELSQIEPELARSLITALHEHGVDPLTPHNQSAHVFIDQVRQQS